MVVTPPLETHGLRGWSARAVGGDGRRRSQLLGADDRVGRHRGGGCRQLARHQVQAGWGCEWLLKAAAANAEEVGTYLVQCGVW